MINPLKLDAGKIPKKDFPYYTPFMEGRNGLEAMLEHVGFRPDDYRKNEVTLERRHTYAYEYIKSKGRNKFIIASEMCDKAYALIAEMYHEIKNAKPKKGNRTFFLDMDWEVMTVSTENGEEMIVWMRGAWCDSKFLDAPAETVIVNHIPKNMMKGC
jgi:hypothetical protein